MVLMEARSPSQQQFRFSDSTPINQGDRSTKRNNYAIRTDSDFVSRDSRLGFIRKVYTIFGAQMATTIMVTYAMINNPQFMTLIYDNYLTVSSVSLLVSLGVIGCLVSIPELRYRSPTNFILLGIHTLMQSIMVGAFSSFVSPKAIIVGAMHTLGVFLAITAYSFQPNPKYDLSGFGSTLLSCLTALLVGSVCNLFFNVSVFDNLLSAASAVLFGVYLFVDTQKIVGGTHHKYQYGQKEYILAALNLYQDAIALYMEIVRILEKREREQKRSQ